MGGRRLGTIQLTRGEIRWYTFRRPDKRRPVLVLTREEVLDVLNEIIVVPATRTIRGLETEVVLTEEDGMPAACALNFDHWRSGIDLGRYYVAFPENRWAEARNALLVACGFQGHFTRSGI